MSPIALCIALGLGLILYLIIGYGVGCLTWNSLKLNNVLEGQSEKYLTIEFKWYHFFLFPVSLGLPFLSQKFRDRSGCNCIQINIDNEYRVYSVDGPIALTIVNQAINRFHKSLYQHPHKRINHERTYKKMQTFFWSFKLLTATVFPAFVYLMFFIGYIGNGLCNLCFDLVEAICNSCFKTNNSSKT